MKTYQSEYNKISELKIRWNMNYWAKSCFEPGFKYLLYQHPANMECDMFSMLHLMLNASYNQGVTTLIYAYP